MVRSYQALVFGFLATHAFDAGAKQVRQLVAAASAGAIDRSQKL
jgi:hypothetical protein